MALLKAGLEYSTLSLEGANLALCTTVDTTNHPEYPGPPMALGTRTFATDAGEYVYCQTAGAYVIGTAGSISNDGSWIFTAATTANSTNSGQMVGVLSQVASTTASPTSSLYDCVWIQIGGGVSGVTVASGTSINALLYTTTAAGVLSSTSASGAVLVTGIVTTTTATSASAQPAVMTAPQVLLT